MPHDIAIERRAFATVPASVRLDSRTAEFVASTEALDSHGTIVRQKWRLDRFRKNPVILYNHDTDHPIGTGDVRMEGGKLICKIKFAEGTTKADECWTLVRQGVLRAISVGFRPHKTSYLEDGGKTTPVYEDNELYEISLATLPSNAEALARAATRGAAPQENNPMADVIPAGAAHADAPADDAVAPEVAALRSALTAVQGVVEQRDEELSIAHKIIEERDAEIQGLRTELGEYRDRELRAHVSSFVGKKFLPPQTDAMLSLARLSRAEFDKLMGSLPDLRLQERLISAPTQPPRIDPTVEFEAAVARHMKDGLSRKDAITRATDELGGPIRKAG